MLLGNIVFEAFLAVSYVTGIAATVGDYAEHAVYSLADVASMQRLEFAIRSRSPEWYHDGMQLLAYKPSDYRWGKSTIKWAIRKNSGTLPVGDVKRVFADAFAEWREEIPLNFDEVSANQQADIRIFFKSMHESDYKRTSFKRPSSPTLLDSQGVDIVYNDEVEWIGENPDDYKRLRFAALHEIGHALGLDNSNWVFRAIMNEPTHAFESTTDVHLLGDDVDGIQILYGSRDGRVKPSPFWVNKSNR